MSKVNSTTPQLIVSPIEPSPEVIVLPQLHDGSTQPLCPDSCLRELPLHEFQLAITHTGADLAQIFAQFPTLPGVILCDRDRWVGMISKQRFLEYLLHPRSNEIFLQEPLSVLHGYTRAHPLILSGSTSILSAAQQTLRRMPQLVGEPIVVQMPDPEHSDQQRHLLLDFHDLNIASWQLRGIETQVWYEQTQLEMLRSTRMASLGRLVDGVSHEILDPVSFIWGNLSHLTDYLRDILGLISLYEQKFPDSPVEIATLREEIELDYLREDIPRTLESIKTGSDRLSKLASSLQNFCHIDEVYPKPANIHECIEGVLLLLKSRLKSEIEIVKDYGHLPPVPCFVGQLSQVFMNILTQAVNLLLYSAAIADMEEELARGQEGRSVSSTRPKIQIATESCSLDGSGHRWIAVRIGHNAPTIPLELQEQITNGFADIKPLTKETELTSSYRIITAKHRGKFKVHCASDPTALLPGGLTTEFEILIPLT
jgi:signal transduction histidine kinase